MPCRAAATDRLEWATQRLLECRSGPQVTADLAAEWGCSRRTARRVVARAYQQIAADLADAGIDRRLLVAQIAHGLQQAAAVGLASNQPAATVAASRELRKLLSLAAAPSPLSRDKQSWEF